MEETRKKICLKLIYYALKDWINERVTHFVLDKQWKKDERISTNFFPKM